MLDKRIEELARQISQEHGYELYDIELKNTNTGRVLRVFITSPNGVNLDDCASISRKFSYELDVLDIVPTKYTLEVSSPGLERTLTKESHYHMAVGETVKVTFKKEDKTYTHIGVLKAVTPTGLVIKQDDNGNEQSGEEYPFDSIKKIRTTFTFNKKSRR